MDTVVRWFGLRSIVVRIGFVLCLAQAHPGSASDGAIEINQAKALAGGITAADGPGFPVLISETGSYVLTSNLDTRHLGAGAASTHAIELFAHNVSIDLNGFSIIGPAVCACSDGPAVCTGTGTGIGIMGHSMDGFSLFNGHVVGAPAEGLWLGEDSRVTDVTIYGNGGIGARADAHAVFERVVSSCNGGYGLFFYVARGGGVARAVKADKNGSDGIRANNGVVSDSVAHNNGGKGISVESGVVSDSVANGNLGGGISGGGGSTVTGNSASDNVGIGIYVLGGLASDNASYNNSTHGFQILGQAGYKGNVANGNGTSAIDLGTNPGSSGVSIGPNVCNGALCP